MHDQFPTTRRSVALASLAVAAFAFVTAEILPVGLLTLIANDLDRSTSQVGLLVTGYAGVVIGASLPLTWLTARIPRRWVLTGVLAVFTAASMATALASTYATLLVARLVTALAQALFWSVVVPAATSLFPPRMQGRTIARLSVGAALAPVLGVPLGTYVGQQAGWRTAFVAMAGIAAATCALAAAFLPVDARGESASTIGVHPDGRGYARLLVVTALAVAGAMTTITYITPFLLDVAGFAATSLGPLLLVEGLGGIVATLTIGRALERFPSASLRTPIVMLAVALAAMYALGTTKLVTIGAMVVIGFGFAAMASAILHRTMQVATIRTDVASAGTSTAYNVGIAAGSYAGALLLARSSGSGEGVSGTHDLPLVGAALLVAAVGVLLTEGRRKNAPRRAAQLSKAPRHNERLSTERLANTRHGNARSSKLAPERRATVHRDGVDCPLVESDGARDGASGDGWVDAECTV